MPPFVSEAHYATSLDSYSFMGSLLLFENYKSYNSPTSLRTPMNLCSNNCDIATGLKKSFEGTQYLARESAPK